MRSCSLVLRSVLALGLPLTAIIACGPRLAAGFHTAAAGSNSALTLHPKKGVVLRSHGPQTAVDLKAGWYYNYSSKPNQGQVAPGQAEPEFVPMIWGAGDVDSRTIERLNQAGTKELLTFNEPDLGGEQSNISVEAALAYWPTLQQFQGRISSPAPSWTDGWFQDFMAKAETNHYRIDFIAVHRYVDTSDLASIALMRSWLVELHERYHRPIWLTEYGAVDCFQAWWCKSERTQALTDTNLDTYLRQHNAMLESLDFVERYAWFSDDATDSMWRRTALLSGDTLTATGRSYRDSGR